MLTNHITCLKRKFVENIFLLTLTLNIGKHAPEFSAQRVDFLLTSHKYKDASLRQCAVKLTNLKISISKEKLHLKPCCPYLNALSLPFSSFMFAPDMMSLMSPFYYWAMYLCWKYHYIQNIVKYSR